MGDCDEILKTGESDTGVSLKRKAPEDGELREYLRIYETMPAQLLNAYSMASDDYKTYYKTYMKFVEGMNETTDLNEYHSTT